MSKKTNKNEITFESLSSLSSNNITDNPRNSLNHHQNSLWASDPVAEAIKSTQYMREMHGAGSAFAEVMKASQQAREMFGARSAIAEAMTSTQQISKMLGTSSAFTEVMKASQQAREMFGAGSVIAEAIKSTQHMREMLGTSSAFAEAMKTSQHMHEMLGSSLASLSNVENFSNAVNLINQEMALEGYVESNIPDPKTIESSISSLSSTNEPKFFSEQFSHTPPAIQLFLLFLLLQVILPQLNSISANLLTPYVNEITENATSSKTDKVREIKKIDPYLYGLPSEELRFISGSNVRLRSGPSTKSKTLDLLMLGQIVVSIEKERSWTNVMIQHDNGDMSTGWVFTRYVEKFRR